MGDLRQARLRRGRDGRHAAGDALRARRRAALAARPRPRASRDPRARAAAIVGIALALGAVGYGAQAGGYFAALERLDASLLVAARLHVPGDRHGGRDRARRERASRRTAVALALASAASCSCSPGAARRAGPARHRARAGGGGRLQRLHPRLRGRRRRVGPLALSTLVCTGAAATLTLGGPRRRRPRPGRVSAAGFGWLGGLAVVSTVGAIGLFFAGLRRVGPTAPPRSSRRSSRW